MARVIFDETDDLGIEFEAQTGTVITIEAKVEEIKIYNGAKEGPINFMISFSNATTLLTALASVIVGALLM